MKDFWPADDMTNQVIEKELLIWHKALLAAHMALLGHVKATACSQSNAEH